MTPITHYYLIDLENVSLHGLYGLSLPGEESEIRIFLSQNAHIATPEIQHDILSSRANIDTFFCSVQTKNALDFQLAAYFGEILVKPDTRRLSIISKDNGYRALVDYAIKVRKDVVVYQGVSILEAYIAATCSTAVKMYVSHKGSRVDFKHIMEELKKKKKFETPIREALTGICNRESMEVVLKIAGKESATPREKYLGMLHAFGRVKGTEIYRIVKDVEQNCEI